MKILVYSSYFKPYTSGLTVYVDRLIGHLKKKNDITLLTFKHDNTLPNHEKTRSQHIVRMPHETRISKGFLSVRSLWYFWRYVRGAEAIVITMPNAEALPLAIMGRILKKRIIALYLCDVDLGPRLTSQIVNAVLNRSIDMQLMLSDKIVAIADYIEHRLAYQKFGDKIVPLLPPIDTPLADQAFVKKLAAGKDRKIWIGFAGRLAREKGIEHLIHALKIIGDNRYELVIAGPQMTVGEHAYSDAIMELLERSRIRYHRFVSLTDSQLASVYEMLDILVLPSINTTEAFGMVQAEAMLHGTPVIATNLPGVRMPVQLTGCGTIVPPANPKAIAGAIKSIINAQFNRSEVIKKARKKFNPDPVYESIESLLLSNK